MKKVLIVDDEVDTLNALKQGLELQGVEVDAFASPTEALGKFAPGRYEVAILDVRMPKMNGFQLFREILRLDGEVRDVFLSAFGEYLSEFRKAFPELDESRFIRKPITIRELKRRLEVARL